MHAFFNWNVFKSVLIFFILFRNFSICKHLSMWTHCDAKLRFQLNYWRRYCRKSLSIIYFCLKCLRLFYEIWFFLLQNQPIMRKWREPLALIFRTIYKVFILTTWATHHAQEPHRSLIHSSQAAVRVSGFIYLPIS